VTGRLLEMPRKTVAEPCAAGRPRALVLLERAIDRVWDSHKAAAIDLGVSEGQLSKWIAGKEKFGVIDIDRSRALRTEYVRLLAEDTGFDVRSVDASVQRQRLIAKKQRELFDLMQEDTNARVSA
jgi:hypothetical protein